MIIHHQDGYHTQGVSQDKKRVSRMLFKFWYHLGHCSYNQIPVSVDSCLLHHILLLYSSPCLSQQEPHLFSKLIQPCNSPGFWPHSTINSPVFWPHSTMQLTCFLTSINHAPHLFSFLIQPCNSPVFWPHSAMQLTCFLNLGNHATQLFSDPIQPWP